MPALTLYTHPQSRGRIARWMLEETGQPYETVENTLDRDHFMTSDEAMEWGLIDKVIEKRSEESA